MKSCRRSSNSLARQSSSASSDKEQTKWPPGGLSGGFFARLTKIQGTLVRTDIDFAAIREAIVEHLRKWGLWEPGVEEGRYILELVAWAKEQLQDDPSRQQQYHQEAKKILHDVELPYCRRADPFSGVPEALQRLHAAGRKIGIITRNSRKGVAAVLCRHPLPYEVLITRDDLSNIKPHQEHLEQALAALGVAGSQALMVGDHATDIQCGQAAGVRTWTCLRWSQPCWMRSCYERDTPANW